MKNNTLKKVTIILLVLVISLISFVGIYTKNLNRMKNALPDYKASMDFGGLREVRLDVSQETETKYFDADGNEVSAPSGENEETGIDSKQVAINPEEVLNAENYSLSKDIITKRMNMFQFKEYQIRQDENGYIVIQLYEDDASNNYMQLVATTGLLEIKDADTNEILFNNNDIKSASATVHTEKNNTSAACLILEFNGQAREKLEEIGKTYVESKVSNDETDEVEDENETEAEAETENVNEEENVQVRELTITFDGETIVSAHFGENVASGNMQILSGGRLQIPLHSATSSESTLYQYLNEATLIERLLNIGKLPIKYEMTYENVFSSVLRQEVIGVLSIAIAVLIIIAVAYLIIRYNKGLLMGISWLGFISLFLLILRFTNSIISMNGIIGIIIVCIFDYIFLNAVLHNKQNKTFNEILTNYSIIGIPLYIVAIVFSFASMVPVSSLGIVMFWGSVLMIAYNFVITKNLLDEK